MSEEIIKKDAEIVAEKPDFTVDKFYTYSGPSYYLDRQSVVFNLYIAEDGPTVDFYKDKVLAKFPHLAENYPSKVVKLFAEVLLAVCRMDLNLFVDRYAIYDDGEEWTIAIQNLETKLTKECIYLVSDWFSALTKKEDFDLTGKWVALQSKFDKTLYGGPTIYSLIEAGVKRNIPVHYLFEENQFQWGYGKKQRRGRSTIFHTDGIKDTEFTTYKDMVGEFLELCGLPTPTGKNCFSEEELIEEALNLGWPVVVKPVAGHKGQGVTTGIDSIDELKKAFKLVLKGHEESGSAFEGALVQKMIFGYDHRILTIGGKFVACLKRVPAYVIGDGKSTIKQLIDADNELEIRADTARSPLCKIKLDEVMIDWLKLQGMTPETIPAKDQEIVLRRVANISAGGVSINVTKDMHPKNIEMAENIAKFFNVTALGIDVLAKDISVPWTEGNFGIIEINAGPGVFMHLAPAFGGAVDVPGKIMESFYGQKFINSRVPIIATNKISNNLNAKIYEALKQIKPDVEYGFAGIDGAYFNNVYFNKSKHDENCKMVLRNPKLDIALFEHDREDIHDFGMWHVGCDIAILDEANYAEYAIKRDLLPNGLLIEIRDVEMSENEVVAKLFAENEELKRKLSAGEILTIPDAENKNMPYDYKKVLFVSKEGKEIQRITVTKDDDVDELIFKALEPHLKELLLKYE